MYGLLTVLMVVGSSWCLKDSKHPYVESRQAFSHARVFLQNLVPHEVRNLSHHEARVHLSGGVLVGTALAVAESIQHGGPYEPLKVLDLMVPAVWDDYNGEAADPVNQKLAELHAKIQPVTAIIDALCPGVDVQTCDSLVHDKVVINNFLKNRADLLLAIGKVSQTVNENETILKQITSEYKDVPVLFNHVDSEEYKQVAYDIADVYRKVNIFTHTHPHQ